MNADARQVERVYLGFTFFSGAVQAWLVDGLKASGFRGQLDAVFARGKVVEGLAMQPHLLQLFGDPKAYGIAGLAPAIVGGAQMGGGFPVPHPARVFRRRTSVLLTAVLLSTVVAYTVPARRATRIDPVIARSGWRPPIEEARLGPAPCEAPGITGIVPGYVVRCRSRAQRQRSLH